MPNKQELIAKIEQVNGIKHSEEQLRVLNSTGGRCILAGAGSGKTTILTELLAINIICGEINPNKLLCTTYSKSGSQEMEDKFKQLTNKLGYNLSISVKTIHASYYKVLSDFGYKINICSESQRLQFLRQIIKEMKVESLLDEDGIDYINNLLAYQVNRALTDDELVDSCAFNDAKCTKEEFAEIRIKYAEKKASVGLVDFDDLQLYMFNLLYFASEEVQTAVTNYCRDLWTWFFIDEFQDTSTIQYKILNKLIPAENKDYLTVIGDDDQSIYKWRGADPNIILEDVLIDYELRKYILPINYRCKDNIVKFAASSVHCLSKRQDKSLKAFEEGGSVEILQAPNYSLYEASKTVCDYIKDLVLNGVDPKDIAVLCRNNNHVLIVNNMLLNEGIYCNSAENMKFSGSLLFKDISVAFDICNDNFSDSLIRQYIWKYVPYLGLTGGNLVANVMKDCFLSLKGAIGWLLNKFEVVSMVNYDANKVKVAAKLEERFRYGYFKLNRTAIEGLVTLYNIINSEENANEKTKLLLYQWYSSVNYMYKSIDRNRLLTGFYHYMSMLLETKTIEQIKALFSLTSQYEKGSSAVLGSKVTLSTLHSAKGKEWKYVILFLCDTISLPGVQEIEKMIEDDRTIDDISDYVDCERRLYYVGCTRAKEKLALICDPRFVSPFVIESLNIGNNSTENNLQIIEQMKYGLSREDTIEAYREVIDSEPYTSEWSKKRNLKIMAQHMTEGMNQ